MNKQIKFILIFSSLLFIFIIFFFGLNKSNIYTPNKVTNIEIPNFESRELFSNQKINAYELIQNVKPNKNQKLKNMLANLKILSGKKPLEALRIC